MKSLLVIFSLAGGFFASNDDAVEFALSHTQLASKENFDKIMELSSEEILSLDDSFIQYLIKSKTIFDSLSTERESLQNTLSILNQKLGEAVFEVFGLDQAFVNQSMQAEVDLAKTHAEFTGKCALIDFRISFN